MKFELNKNFKRNIKGVIEHYYFQVGMLNAETERHKYPKGYLKHGHKAFFNGLPARKTSRKKSETTFGEISKKWREKTDYLNRPFKMRRNKDIIIMLKEFFKVIKSNKPTKRLTNLVQAIVRNPILRLDYGSNNLETIRKKGFNALMIDTGQFFLKIKARVFHRGRNV